MNSTKITETKLPEDIFPSPWVLSWRADPEVVPLADRHYNRQKVGSPQFAPPGRCVVLKAYGVSGDVVAFWITSWPYAEYVKHQWAGAWVCSAFRNESRDYLSSTLIRYAVSHTHAVYGDAPDMGMITFVNARKVKPKRDPGMCYLRAGFTHAGETKGGLIALQQLGDTMPNPEMPRDCVGRPTKKVGKKAAA